MDRAFENTALVRSAARRGGPGHLDSCRGREPLLQIAPVHLVDAVRIHDTISGDAVPRGLSTAASRPASAVSAAAQFDLDARPTWPFVPLSAVTGTGRPRRERGHRRLRVREGDLAGPTLLTSSPAARILRRASAAPYATPAGRAVAVPGPPVEVRLPPSSRHDRRPRSPQRQACAGQPVDERVSGGRRDDCQHLARVPDPR